MMLIKKMTLRMAFVIALIMVFPFLLKTGINGDAVQHQALLSLYRDWRWSPDVQALRAGSIVRFEPLQEKSQLEEFFKAQLQQDFKLTETGNFPRIRVFFVSDSFLHGRFEIKSTSGPGEWLAWTGHTRYVNNGILLGAWLGLVLWLLGRRLRSAIGISVFSMLLWQVNWNVIDLPGHFLHIFGLVGNELRWRYFYDEWIGGEWGRLAELAAVAWFLLNVFLVVVLRKFFSSGRFKSRMIIGFLMEPVAFWVGSRLGQWGADALWWKIYIGSFAFRFVTVAQGLMWYFGYKGSLQKKSQTVFPEEGLWGLLSLLPLAFIFSGGWEWIHSVLYAGVGDTLLRLKIFLVSAIVAFVMGSRVFSLVLGVLTLSIIFPPSHGHWAASAAYGLMADGLLLGWLATPFNGFSYLKGLRATPILTVTLLAWLMGTLLSSVGVPLGLCWAAVVLGVWTYTQLYFLDAVDGAGTSAEVSEGRALVESTS